MERGRLFEITRFFVRPWLGRCDVEVDPPEKPSVFVCSHSNLHGPLATQCWLPFPTRIWVFHMFLTKEGCREQYRDYTFSQRLGMPKPLAAALAWAVSGYVSSLLQSIRAIPVYRGMAKLKETFRETVAALQSGDSVLIFPDVDYTDESDGIGEMYDGFLLLDRLWRRVSDEPLDFIPLRLDAARRRLAAGKTVCFDHSAADRKQEMIRVKEALRDEMNRE